MAGSENLLCNINLTIFTFILIQFSEGILEFKAGIVMVEKSVLPFKQEMVGPAIDMAIEVSFLFVKTYFSKDCGVIVFMGSEPHGWGKINSCTFLWYLELSSHFKITTKNWGIQSLQLCHLNHKKILDETQSLSIMATKSGSFGWTKIYKVPLLFCIFTHHSEFSASALSKYCRQ